MNEWIWSNGGTTITGEKKKYAEKNLSQCYFIHHKSHLVSPWNELGSPHWKSGDWPSEKNASHKCDRYIYAVFHITISVGLLVTVIGLGGKPLHGAYTMLLNHAQFRRNITLLNV